VRKLHDFYLQGMASASVLLGQSKTANRDIHCVKMASTVTDAQPSWLQLPDLVMTRLVTELLDSLAVKTMRLVSKEWRTSVDRNVLALKPRAIAGDGEVVRAFFQVYCIR
jgi:hypothetical protein